jgi:lysophospholipase L1-like esterase
MGAALPLRSQRLRLLLLVSPGAVVLVASVAMFLAALRLPWIDFGKRKLLTFTAVGLGLTGAGVLLHRKALADLQSSGRPYGKTVLFVSVPVVLVPVLMIVAVDQAIGLYSRVSPPGPLLVFPAHSRVSYHTPEFSFTAETNAIGIRDREVNLQKKEKFRVLALGDSFTYGWGVDGAQAWPKVAERMLAEKGRDAEVLNLGCPGSSVDAYALIAEKAIPLLQPDLVLVAVLQGDDLKQLDLGSTTDKLFKLNGVRSDEGSDGVVATVLPHITALIARMPRSVSADEVREVWKGNVRGIQDRLSAEERERFAALDPDFKKLFLAGELNPWDVNAALKYPDYMDFTLHPDWEDVRRAVGSMAASLGIIHAAAGRANARVMAVSVPAGCYTCKKGLEARRREGFHLEDAALRSHAPDEVIRSAAKAAGVEFRTFLSRFREVGAGRDLYFEFDGHFNAEGHALFAEQVVELLQAGEGGTRVGN